MAVSDRPTFHMSPETGWINDPNGPLLYNGKYHLFYQHVPNSTEWQWGLVWGHAVSDDLVDWTHLPVVLEPTRHSPDTDGCFSGCATVDLEGKPAILYTGVIKKAPHEIVPDVSPQHESQLVAVPVDAADDDLKEWKKLPGSFLPKPAADMDLTGWRDPFIIERPTADNPYWVCMIGAGVRGVAGTAMVYRSKDLYSGWEYAGELCRDTNSTMWECPLLAQLTPHESVAVGSEPTKHFFCVNPDFCANVSEYWLGDYSHGRFDIATADGPHKLDLGDILYAPNLMQDKKGRTVYWAWMQERQRPVGDHDYSCCLCVPRVMSLKNGKLFQEPLPELTELREPQRAWQVTEAVPLMSKVPISIAKGVTGDHVDVEISVTRGTATSFALLLQPYVGCGGKGAAVAFNWVTGTLQMIHSVDLSEVELTAAVALVGKDDAEHLHASDQTAATERDASAAGPLAGGATAGVLLPHRAGGVLQLAPGQTKLTLRVLIDHSCVEVFTCTGQVLGTRVYRGNPSANTPSNLELVAFGGNCELVSGGAWEMCSMWAQELGVAPAADVAEGVIAKGLTVETCQMEALHEEDLLSGTPQTPTAIMVES
eukprot:jgi/Chrzof1/8047/UNPLg00092.t1